VEGRDRARLFCGLRLPDQALDALQQWQSEHIEDGRPVARDHLHVTLAFLGHRRVAELEPILGALREAAAAAGPIRLVPERYRETRSVGMLTLDDESGWATTIAARLHAGLEQLGVYRSEARPWLAHLTVLRFKERPRLDPVLPEPGEVVPSDAAVFISRLRPGGAEYESVETVALGG